MSSVLSIEIPAAEDSLSGSAHAARLLARIRSREAHVGVVGLGYVGLPLTLVFHEKGYPVTGFDLDAEKGRMLSAGRSYIRHIAPERIARANARGNFSATVDFGRLSGCDAILICVPTPLTPQREPDMTYVIATARSIAAHLREGQLVVLESTTYPGTTDELVRGILEETGLRCGEDFFLAFSPEREDPGNPSFATATIPKVVGGVDAVSGDLAEALYAEVIEAGTVRVSAARTAEATKLVENIFRAVNIALVNELKIVFDRLGIDIWEVLDAASTKPFGFMRFNPGPGWGGHCIPLDPFYLVWKAREYGVIPKFIELAGEVNVQMPHYVLEKLQHALNERGKPVKGSRILVLGLAYKKNVDDARESPAFEFINELLGLGAVVSYHDPHVARAPRMRTWPDLPPMQSTPLTPEALEAQDAVVVITDHAAVDYEMVARHAPFVVDTRGVYRNGQANVVHA